MSLSMEFCLHEYLIVIQEKYLEDKANDDVAMMSYC